MDSDDDTSSLDAPITWFSPWNYPTRIDDEMAVRIAEQVRHGVTIRSACMREGIAPSRAMEWLEWGGEAYARGAGPSDYQAQYLNFFLKMLQASGIASSEAQRLSHHNSPGWWLSHAPEHRGDWGSGAPQVQPLLPGGTAGEGMRGPEPVVSLPVPPESLRNVLRMLVETGAALAPEERVNEIVDEGNADVEGAG